MTFEQWKASRHNLGLSNNIPDLLERYEQEQKRARLEAEKRAKLKHWLHDGEGER